MKKLNKLYINGEFVTPHGTEILDLFSPMTGEKMAEVTLGDEIDTQNAVKAAKEAFKTFSVTGREERRKYLLNMHEVLKRRKEDLINIMMEEYGCPYYFSELIIQ